MNTWFLVLILSTPGQSSEHYITLQTPTREACEIMRDEYFAYAVEHADDAEGPGTPMVVIDKTCEPAVKS